MSLAGEYTFFREVQSPITAKQLTPPAPQCRRVQFSEPLSEKDHERLAKFLEDYSEIGLRVYGDYRNGLPNLSFLKWYPSLTKLEVDVYRLESTAGIEALGSHLKSFGFSQTKKKNLSLTFLRRFPALDDLYLEAQTRDFNCVSDLVNLRRLTLRSITLPNLAPLLSLSALCSLDIKLGGTKDLALLPRIGRLKSLELWRIQGLQDLHVISEIPTLQNLFLQALKNVRELPSFRTLRELRRVTLHTMRGLKSLAPLAKAPALEELIVLSCGQFDCEDFKPFLNCKSLKASAVALGSIKKNTTVQQMLRIPKCPSYAEFRCR